MDLQCFFAKLLGKDLMFNLEKIFINYDKGFRILLICNFCNISLTNYDIGNLDMT